MVDNNYFFLIPGILDGKAILRSTKKTWKQKYGINLETFETGWLRKETDFKLVLKKAVDKIDKVFLNHKKIFLIGISAGGSLAINIFQKRPDKICQVLCINSPLRLGYSPILKATSKISPVFAESILRLDEISDCLSENQRKKIILAKSRLDGWVPKSAMVFPGARMINFFGIGHILSINSAMRFYSRKLIKSLLEYQ